MNRWAKRECVRTKRGAVVCGYTVASPPRARGNPAAAKRLPASAPEKPRWLPIARRNSLGQFEPGTWQFCRDTVPEAPAPRRTMDTPAPRVRLAPPPKVPKPPRVKKEKPLGKRELWATSPPGTPYPCKNDLIGKLTRPPVREVIACATPLLPSAGQQRRGTGQTDRRAAFQLRDLATGELTILSRSKTRELTRPLRGALIKPIEGARYAGFGVQMLEASSAPGHIPEAPGVWYVIRSGGSPCLEDGPVWGPLKALVEQAKSYVRQTMGRDPSDAEVFEMVRNEPEFLEAARVERECIRAWVERDERMKAKYTSSPQREQQQARAAFFGQSGYRSQDPDEGVNEQDYYDTLSPKTRAARERKIRGR